MAEEQPQQLTAAQRKRNVAAVRGVHERLGDVENALLAMSAQIPAMVREVQRMRAELGEALSGRPAAEVTEEEMVEMMRWYDESQPEHRPWEELAEAAREEPEGA